jgi:PAS domain S-box-containing protein
MQNDKVNQSAEEGLRQEINKYRALIETTDTGFVIFNNECKVVDANPEYVRLAGRTHLDEVIGHHVTEWMASGEYSKKEAAIDNCLKEGSVRGLEIDYIGPSGEIIPVEINATAVETDRGRQILCLCRDISRRRQAERKLRETERRLADIIDFLPDATFAVNLRGEIIVWNRAIEELTGVRAKDVMHKGNREYSLPFYGARTPALIDYILTPSDQIGKRYTNVKMEGNNVVAEVPVIMANQKRHLWLKASRLYDNEGNLIGAIESIRDVTARKETEKALLDTESFIKSILNSIGTGVVIVDAETHQIIDINDQALKLIGTDRESAKGRICHQFICPANRGACPISDLKKTVDNSERVLLSAGGKAIPILKTVIQVVNNGKGYLIESFWDITDRKRAEKELKLDESRLSALLHLHQMINATESEIIQFALKEAVDLTRSTAGYIAFVDEEESILAIYNWSASTGKENPTQQAVTRCPLDTPGLWSEAISQRKPIISDEQTKVESDPKAGQGNSVSIFRHMDVPIGDGNRIVVIAGVANKPTEYDDADIRQLTLLMSGLWSIIQRKRSQEQALILQDKLDRAQRMESLGVLAGGVAHDLNNMLGPVAGFSELVLGELPGGSRLFNRVSKIMKSAQDAADVIQDLLTLARRGRYEMGPLLLNDVITAYLESPGYAKLKERHPNVEIDINLASDLKPINGSHVHLSKVVMNLVSNACEAIAETGKLSLQTESRQIEALYGGYSRIKEGEYVILKVRDSGVGIGPEDLEKIFEPYYSKKKLGHSGSGLGLSVVYGVVKDHGGYYDIFSEPGKGTEFILYFPVSEDAIPAGENQNQIAGGTEHILIVDDSQDQCDLAKEMISTLGYRVDVAKSGREALLFLKRKPVDIVVLDMIMELDFDGLDTYREIIKMWPNQRVIIVSGYSVTERVLTMQDLGAGVFVKKPYSMNAIARALREELDHAPRNAIIDPII